MPIEFSTVWSVVKPIWEKIVRGKPPQTPILPAPTGERTPETVAALRSVFAVSRTKDNQSVEVLLDKLRTIEEIASPWSLDPIDKARAELLSLQALQAIETSLETNAVWLVTEDLRPDRDDAQVGKMVKANLERGVAYTYFIPEVLLDEEVKIDELFHNIGLDKTSRLRRRIELVRVPREAGLFLEGCNYICFFKLNHSSPYDVLREIAAASPTERSRVWERVHLLRAEAKVALMKKHFEAHRSSSRKTPKKA